MKNHTHSTPKHISLQEKTQQEKDNDWIEKQKKWSTPAEQQTMEYYISKRRNLQSRLEQLRKKTNTQTNKIHLTKSLHAWKQYIQERKKKNTTKQHTTNQIHRTQS